MLPTPVRVLSSSVACLVLAAIWSLLFFGWRYAHVDASSVRGHGGAPAIEDGDVAIVDRTAVIGRYDLVVFDLPSDKSSLKHGTNEPSSRRWIGRVIALSAETVEISSDVRVNDAVVPSQV